MSLLLINLHQQCHFPFFVLFIEQTIELVILVSLSLVLLLKKVTLMTLLEGFLVRLMIGITKILLEGSLMRFE